MATWSKRPVIYEVNAWVWCGELRRKYGRAVTLETVPGEEWDGLASLGADAVWLMGVWERSPAGIAIANRNEHLLEDFRRTLPDFRTEDDVGSGYCVRRYEVDAHLGGRRGLAVARAELARRGTKLVLDFVPNHVAPDHPWVAEHPEYFVHGSADEASSDPTAFIASGGAVFACGRDPYFPAWPDVLQLDAFRPELRRAATQVLQDIARQCDGVRCDMAMLVLNQVFERTWGGRVGPRPATEYWVDVLGSVKEANPGFLAMAEAYWDLEYELQRLGFDYCYDKRLYDRLKGDTAESVRLHLCADLAYQEKLVRFIENHDEPRARSAFAPPKDRAAAVVMATIPGAKLLYEGQLEGRKVKLPVFLGRRPVEPVDAELGAFYRALLRVAVSSTVREGEWKLCERSGWSDNASYQNLVAWAWRGAEDRLLVVVNLSDAGAQGRVRLPWEELRGRTWQTTDVFDGRTYQRTGDELCGEGLYVELPAWGFHVMDRWAPAA
jgi:glycosidase